jgi:hypothetical protein
LEYKKVIRLAMPHPDKLLELRFAGVTQSLNPTPNHPFFVEVAGDDAGKWVPASQIKTRDSVLTRKGTWTKVIAIAPVENEQTVYNFEVEDNHDYFVGYAGILVHNTFCLGKTEGLPEFAKSVGGDTYKSLDLSNDLSSVTNIIESGEDIAINLEQAPGVIADEVTNVANGANSITPTAFEQELRWVADNPQTWDQITWYEGNTVVENPFQ